MSATTIVTWPMLSSRDQGIWLDRFREIFFLTSARKSFSSQTERDEFWARWTTYYFDKSPDLILLAIDQKLSRLAGYLTAAPDSEAAREYYKDRLPSYAIFADLFAEFPAHLHINCHPDFQGSGVGTQLMLQLFELLAQRNSGGVHLVTSPDAQNVKFYQRMGFDYNVRRQFNAQVSLLFMGKSLKPSVLAG